MLSIGTAPVCLRVLQCRRKLQTGPCFQGEGGQPSGLRCLLASNETVGSCLGPYACFGRFAYSYSQAEKRLQGESRGLFKGIKASAIQAARKDPGTENIVEIVVTGHGTGGAC